MVFLWFGYVFPYFTCSHCIFGGPNYKCYARETRQGDLYSFFHADSENQIFDMHFSLRSKIFFTRLPPGDQILILTENPKLGTPKMLKNCLQNFQF